MADAVNPVPSDRRGGVFALSRRSRRTLTGLAGAAAAAALAVGLLTGAHMGRHPAPPLPRAVVHPPAVTIASLRGHPAVIVFWASSCIPCHAEAAAIERAARARIRGARVVGVDYSDDLGYARAFIKRYGWSFPNLADPDGTAGERFGLTGLPTTIVLDAQGRITATLLGAQTVRSLDAALAAA